VGERPDGSAVTSAGIRSLRRTSDSDLHDGGWEHIRRRNGDDHGCDRGRDDHYTKPTERHRPTPGGVHGADSASGCEQTLEAIAMVPDKRPEAVGDGAIHDQQGETSATAGWL